MEDGLGIRALDVLEESRVRRAGAVLQKSGKRPAARSGSAASPSRPSPGDQDRRIAGTPTDPCSVSPRARAASARRNPSRAPSHRGRECRARPECARGQPYPATRPCRQLRLVAEVEGELDRLGSHRRRCPTAPPPRSRGPPTPRAASRHVASTRHRRVESAIRRTEARMRRVATLDAATGRAWRRPVRSPRSQSGSSDSATLSSRSRR